MRAVGPARPGRSDARKVGALVQGRHGGKVQKPCLDPALKQSGRHKVGAAMDHTVADGVRRNRRQGVEKRFKRLAMIAGARWFNRFHFARAPDCELRVLAPNAAQMRTPYDIGRKTRNAHAR